MSRALERRGNVRPKDLRVLGANFSRTTSRASQCCDCREIYILMYASFEVDSWQKAKLRCEGSSPDGGGCRSGFGKASSL